jgi:hypothetical protein
VKVNDLKRPKLEEGFIDNFIAKIQNMAGGDGPTGVIRAMRGQNAALNKFADSIANATTPKVTARLGNQANNVNDRSAPTPVGMILKQAEAIGVAMASKEGISVTPAEIQSAIIDNKVEILKMLIAGRDADDNILRPIFQAITTRVPSVGLTNDLADSIRTISLIVAGTIIFIKTTKEDLEDYNIEPADLESFNAAGEQVKEILFDPTSPDIRALQPNEDFKDHMQWLIIQMVKTVKERYAVLDNAKLQGLLANPPALVSPLQLKSALSGHSASVNPDAVNQLIAKATPAIQNQFKIWLEIAVKETAAGGPPNQSSHLYVDPWGKTAIELVDNMKFGAPAKAKAEPNISPDAEEEIQSLTDSHTAGQTALRNALATNPNLTPAQMKDVYDKAREAYNNANPTP